MQTLEVAIGLVFVYLMLSLVCTAANELLSQWFNSRATTLKAGIDALLRNVTDPIDSAAEALSVSGPSMHTRPRNRRLRHTRRVSSPYGKLRHALQKMPRLCTSRCARGCAPSRVAICSR